MKTLIAIAILSISTIAAAQQSGSIVIPVTVTGGTIEIDPLDLPAIPCQDGMSENERKEVTMSRIRLTEEEHRILQEKIDVMIKERLSRFYDHIDVLD